MTERYDKSEPVNLNQVQGGIRRRLTLGAWSFHHGFGLGSGQEIMIKDLAELIRELTGYQGRIALDPSKSNGQPRCCLDISRAELALGFRAKTDVRTGLLVRPGATRGR
jgi:nucleoside-diphosphate-sugar epimerase